MKNKDNFKNKFVFYIFRESNTIIYQDYNIYHNKIKLWFCFYELFFLLIILNCYFSSLHISIYDFKEPLIDYNIV